MEHRGLIAGIRGSSVPNYSLLVALRKIPTILVQKPELQHRPVVTAFCRFPIQGNSLGSILIDPVTAPVPFRKTVHGAPVTSGGGGLNPIEIHSIPKVAGQASERFGVCGDQGYEDDD